MEKGVLWWGFMNFHVVKCKKSLPFHTEMFTQLQQANSNMLCIVLQQQITECKANNNFLKNNQTIHTCLYRQHYLVNKKDSIVLKRFVLETIKLWIYVRAEQISNMLLFGLDCFPLHIYNGFELHDLEEHFLSG